MSLAPTSLIPAYLRPNCGTSTGRHDVATASSTWEAKDLVLPLLLLVYFHLAVVRVEDPALRQHFNLTYKEYCKRVPSWFSAPTSPRRAAHQRRGTGGASGPS